MQTLRQGCNLSSAARKKFNLVIFLAETPNNSCHNTGMTDNKTSAQEDPDVAGYPAEDLVKAPLVPPQPHVTPQERRFLRKQVGRSKRSGLILSIVGGGFLLLDLWALLFLPTFSLASVLILAIVGLLLFGGSFIMKLLP